MGRRIAGSLILLLIVFYLTGCWNRRELRELGIVGMTGVEKADSGVKVTVELIKPHQPGSTKTGQGGGGDAGKKRAVVNMQADGESIYDAIRNASLKSDRKFFYPHSAIWIFSEDIARMGLASQMDFIFRDHEVRPYAPILIAVDASPSEMMGLAAGTETIPSKYIQGIVRGGKSNAKSVDIKILNFMQMYKATEINPVAGVLRKVKKPKIGTKVEKYELTNEGAAVFLKDKLVGFLSGEEARGYNWVMGKVKSTIVESQSPDGQGRTTVEIFHADSNKKLEITNGTIKAKVKINVTGSLAEEMGSANLRDPAVLALAEASTAQTIKREAKRTITIVQREYRSDIFGFGQIVHRQYPQEWKNIENDWDNTFARTEIEVTVEVKLARMGKLANPIAE
jgi:spore germination protein KC